MSQHSFLQLGNRDESDQIIGLYPADCRHRVYALGKTGTGKSTLLSHRFLQHVLLEHGGCFVDPHGGLAEELLPLIPRKRINVAIR